MKHKVLFIMQLPPPVHGASVMNRYIKQSELINDKFITYFLPLSFAKNVDDIGHISFYKLYKMITLTFMLIRRLIEIKPKVVYYTIAPFGGAFYRDAFYIFLIKLFNTKVLLHLHGKGIEEESKNYFKRKIYKFVFKKTSVILLSKMLSYDIKKIHTGDIYYIPNGVEVNEQKEVLITSETIKVLYLSNLVITKGILDLIDAFELMKDTHINYQLDIIGNSADISINELKTIVEKRNLTHLINVIGPKYGEEKWKALYESDIFVFPTYFKNECFPLVILEAMQTGNAIISTNNGAIEEIIKNCGIVIPKNSPKDIAIALHELLIDKERIEDLKEKSKIEYHEKFTLEIFEKNLIKILESILDETV